jgi:hypothetical protein
MYEYQGSIESRYVIEPPTVAAYGRITDHAFAEPVTGHQASWLSIFGVRSSV